MNDGWRLISPPENWRNPIPIAEQMLSVLEETGRRLGLVTNRNDEQKKLYLGQPRLPSPVPASATGPRVTYPSGRWFSVVVPSEAEAARYGVTGSYAAARLIQAPADAKLSDHFVAGEFAPDDPTYRFLRVSPALLRKLEQLRAALANRPVHITSGYRPPAYNQMVGGAPQSAHIDGVAADLYCPGVSTYELYVAADHIIAADGGVGYYPTQEFVHVDVRDSLARWIG